MATISGSTRARARGVIVTTWNFTSGMASGDVGTPLDAPMFPDKTVHVLGPTGGTTAVVIEGTSESATTATGPTATAVWTTLTSPEEGTAATGLVYNAAGTNVILENPAYLRPRINTVTSAFAHAIVIHITSQSSKR